MKKVDKGFQILYWKLSNRRKFIRSLWLGMPIVTWGIVALWFKEESILQNILVTIVVLSVCYWEIRDTYSESKKEEKKL